MSYSWHALLYGQTVHYHTYNPAMRTRLTRHMRLQSTVGYQRTRARTTENL
jgi:hypothetical protein